MTSVLQIVSFFITGVTMSIIFFDFFNELFQKKFHNKEYYVFAYFLFCIGFLFSILLSTPFIRFFFPAILPFIFGAFLYSNFSFSITLFFILIIQFCEISIESLTYFVFNGNFSIMPNNLLRNLLIFSLYQFVMIFIKNRNRNYMSKKSSFTIFLFPLFSLVIIYFSVILTIQSQENQLVTLSTIIGIGLLFGNIFIFYLFQQIQSYAEKETLFQIRNQQSKLQYQYVKELEAKTLETKKILHDIKWHLSVLKSLDATNNSTQHFFNYFEQVNLKIDSVENHNYTDSPIVNLLINNKKLFAINHEIRYSTICEKFSFDFMKEIDQTILFSNILDNAFEGATMSSELNKFVSLTICTINDFKIINITNSYAPDKHKDKKKHMGLGLQNVQDVAEKYQGELTITDNRDSKIFEVHLTFF